MMSQEAPAELNAGALTSSRRFELLIHAIKDYAIYMLDLDGRVISWNTGSERFKGYTADEVNGRHFSCFYTAEDCLADMPARGLRLAASQGSYETEGWRVRKDGSRFWASVVIDPVVDETGTLIGYAKITRDMTDKRAAQQALFESEQRFRMLVEAVHDYAIYMLDANGNITNWNAGAALIKGYSAEEIIGSHFSRFYTPEDQERGEPQRGLAAAAQHNTFQNEGWRVRKNGSRFWASVVIDPIYSESGKLVGFAKITRDITERKLAQEELDRHREELAQSQKLEAIGRLTGGVSHDFNNLLMIIKSASELLSTTTLTPQKQARYIKMISETTDRAVVLTRQLLAFARQQPLQPEAFDAAARMHGLTQVLKTILGAEIKLDVNFPQDLAAIEADPGQFETAILNMVINARDAMPNGGLLSISGRNDVTPMSLARIGGVPCHRYVAITLSDTGTGIAPAILEHIFEPFYTTKAVNKGTGLGLSQIYGFAKQSGGELEVKSELGQGASFTLYLPAAT